MFQHVLRGFVSVSTGIVLVSASAQLAVAQCGSRSPLACASVPVAMPYQLNWAASEGGILAGDGLGTGFTVVEPHTNDFDPAVPANPALNGYEPSWLDVDTSGGGSLKITTSRGIQYRDPAFSSNTNSLVNGLGVGVVPTGSTIRIEATLSNMPSGTNMAEQPGLWVWLNEDNLVKVAIISTNVGTDYKFQLQVEDYPPTAAGFPATSAAPLEINTGSFNLAAISPKITLLLNPSTSTFTGYYDIGAGDVLIGSFPQAANAPGSTSTCAGGVCPTPGAEFFAGIDHDSNGGTPNVILAGIYTTQRNNATTTPRKLFNFDSFRIGQSCTTNGDCSDSNMCTGVETCVANLCQPGTPLVCNDGNLCNGTETCSPTLGCQAGTPLVCNDGNLCNGTETCSPTLGCQAGTPLNCDDGDVCTGTETCSPTLGCQAGTPLNCDDGDVCTGTETCNATLGCQPGTPLSCGNGNACDGIETCSPTLGCQPGTPPVCDDGNVCNGTETCSPALGCQPGTSLNCDDGNPCTTDSCDMSAGCLNPNNTDPCDDGNACTSGDVCSGGVCAGSAVGLCCAPADTFTLNTMVKKTVVKNKTTPAQDKVIAKGAFVSSGAFSPTTQDFSVGITDDVGTVYQGTIASGQFQASASGTSFRFKDESAPYEQDGLYVAKLKVMSDNATVKYVLKARGLDLPTPGTGVGSLVIKVGDKCYVDGNHTCVVRGPTAKCQ